MKRYTTFDLVLAFICGVTLMTFAVLDWFLYIECTCR